jgi:hypothetical protein
VAFVDYYETTMWNISPGQGLGAGNLHGRRGLSAKILPLDNTYMANPLALEGGHGLFN